MNTFVKEYRWPFIATLLILALSFVPLWTGYAAQTPELRFIGTFVNRQDYTVHLALTHYGEQGAWDSQFRFTTEPQNPTYLKTLYVVFGHLGRLFGIPAEILFRIEHFIFGMLACLAIYYLLTFIFPTVQQRRLAFVLAILGAGLGWIQIPLGLVPERSLSPIDFWLIDAYIFFNIATLPHLAMTIAGMAFSLALFLRHLQKPHWLNIAIIAVCAFIVQFVNPVAFLIVDMAFAGIVAFACWKNQKLDWKLMLTVGLLGVLQLPLLLYSFLLMNRDPAWIEFSRQNITLTPPPIYLLFGFGLLWIFALPGMIKAIRQRDVNLGWAAVWVVAAIVMSYLPLAVQRRFLLAISLPIAILATPMLLAFSEWLHRRLRLSKFTGAIVIGAFMILSPLLMISAFSTDMKSHPADLFEPASLFDAADWLSKNGTSTQVVLAAEPTAQLVAMRSPLKLYFGHVMETLYYDEKSQLVENFYRGKQPTGWLESQGIDWVIFGPHEKKWGVSAPDLPNLKISFQNDEVTIYKVVAP
jgi:hypothetical protein